MKAARAERKKSDKLKAQAEFITRDLHSIREQNHFAEALQNLIEGNRK